MRTIYIVLLSLFALVPVYGLYSAVSVILAIVNYESPPRSAQDSIPRVEYLEETDYAKYFVLHNFTDDERGIQYLLDYARNSVIGRSFLVTDRWMVRFEDGDANFDKSKGRIFFLRNEKERFSILRLNSNENYEKIELDKNLSDRRAELSADFDSINVNILQQFIDYSNNDLLKRDVDTYTYELYDRHGNKRVEQVYHDRGEWFTFDIIDKEKTTDNTN